MRLGLLGVLLWASFGFAAFDLTWGIPAISLDSNPPVGDADVNPAIAIDSSGNAVAAWGRTNGNGATEDIWAATYNHGSRIWISSVKISGGSSASNAVVGMDGDGNAIFVWEEGFPTQILSRTLSATGVWSPPLSSPPTEVCNSIHAQEFPQIVVDENGGVLAVWMESFRGVNRIQSARKPSGSNWIKLGSISSGLNNATLTMPRPFASNSSGSATLVWEESNGNSANILAAQYAKGAWMRSVAVSPGTQPSVGIDAAGNAVIAWSVENGIRSAKLSNGIMSKILAVSNPAFIAQHSCIAVDQEGNAVVVFERFDGSVMHKFVTGSILSANSDEWSVPVDISVPSPVEASNAGYPILSLNPIGDGVTIWKEFDGTYTLIQGAGYSLGTWSFIRTLSSQEENAGSSIPAYDIDVSLNLAGNLIAIWPEDSSGSNTPQIKAAPGIGLAIAGPLPPVIVDEESISLGIGKGRQVLHRFPAHADLINLIEWASPGGVESYNIYRGNLASRIGTTKTPYFEDHQRIPGERVTYLITSVDTYNHESGPMTIIVHPR